MLVLEFSVHENHLDELEEVRNAAEHAGTPDGEELLQHPRAFVVDFALDFTVAELAEFCRRDFRFRDACERVVAGTGHAERRKESLVPLFLQTFASQPLQQDAEQYACGVPVVEYRSRRRFELVGIEGVKDPFGRERRERLHRDAVVETVREQVGNVNLVTIVCLKFRDEVDDFGVNRKLAFEDVCKRERRSGADLRERRDVKDCVFGSVQCDGVACAVGQQVACDSLVKNIFRFCSF